MFSREETQNILKWTESVSESLWTSWTAWPRSEHSVRMTQEAQLALCARVVFILGRGVPGVFIRDLVRNNNFVTHISRQEQREESGSD